MLQVNKLKQISLYINTTGFTLAEVLVTLAIIGIVAALTVPSLITRIQDQQYHTAWKKSFSQISNAYANYLNDINGTGLDASPDLDANLTAIIPYLKVLKRCDWNSREECWHPDGEVSNLNGTPGQGGNLDQIILADGTRIVSANHGWGDCSGYGGACAMLVVDVNGAKPPNTVGKDIYSLYLMPNRVKPACFTWNDACVCTEPPAAGWDDAANEGYGCSQKYLME